MDTIYPSFVDPADKDLQGRETSSREDSEGFQEGSLRKIVAARRPKALKYLKNKYQEKPENIKIKC